MGLRILAEQGFPMGAVLFYLFAGAAVVSGCGVVVSRKIVRQAVFLLFALASVAGLYYLLGCEFLGAVQLVVYAGGTLILIIFGVMLTNSEAAEKFAARRGEVRIAMGIGVVLLFGLIVGLSAAVSSGAFPAGPLGSDESYPVDRLGAALLGDYLVPFEIVSVLLLVVMIGAAYLAKARRKGTDVRHEDSV